MKSFRSILRKAETVDSTSASAKKTSRKRSASLGPIAEVLASLRREQEVIVDDAHSSTVKVLIEDTLGGKK